MEAVLKENTLSVLSGRLSLLEARLGAVNSDDIRYLPDRVKEISARISLIESEIPGLTACFEMIKQLKPLLNKRQGYVNYTLSCIHELSSRREEIISWVNNMKEIERFKVYPQDLSELKKYQSELTSLETKVGELTQLMNRQTKELDSLLDLYDKAMIAVSDKCLEWHDKISRLEAAKIKT